MNYQGTRAMFLIILPGSRKNVILLLYLYRICTYICSFNRTSFLFLRIFRSSLTPSQNLVPSRHLSRVRKSTTTGLGGLGDSTPTFYLFERSMEGVVHSSRMCHQNRLLFDPKRQATYKMTAGLSERYAKFFVSEWMFFRYHPFLHLCHHQKRANTPSSCSRSFANNCNDNVNIVTF